MSDGSRPGVAIGERGLISSMVGYCSLYWLSLTMWNFKEIANLLGDRGGDRTRGPRIKSAGINTQFVKVSNRFRLYREWRGTACRG